MATVSLSPLHQFYPAQKSCLDLLIFHRWPMVQSLDLYLPHQHLLYHRGGSYESYFIWCSGGLLPFGHISQLCTTYALWHDGQMSTISPLVIWWVPASPRDFHRVPFLRTIVLHNLHTEIKYWWTLKKTHKTHYCARWYLLSTPNNSTTRGHVRKYCFCNWRGTNWHSPYPKLLRIFDLLEI